MNFDLKSVDEVASCLPTDNTRNLDETNRLEYKAMERIFPFVRETTRTKLVNKPVRVFSL